MEGSPEGGEVVEGSPERGGGGRYGAREIEREKDKETKIEI